MYASMGEAFCTQERSCGSNESLYVTSHYFVSQGKHGGKVCIGMQASNIQTKQAYRQSWHCEPSEAKGAIESGIQEAPSL